MAVGGSVHAAGFEVDTLSDNPADGFTLREAITAANGAAGDDVITFADGLTGTISLATGQLDMIDSVSIVGPGSGSLTIDAGGASRIFHSFTPDLDLSFEGLTLANGEHAAFGGAIVVHNADVLELDDVVITNSSAPQGGAIEAVDIDERIRLSDSVLVGNVATLAHGGGIRVDAPSAGLLIEDTTIEGNDSAAGDGGGIWADADWLTIIDSSLVDNDADAHGGGVLGTADFVQIIRSSFVGNEAGSGWGAGRLESGSSNLIVRDVEVTDNRSGPLPAGLVLHSTNGHVSVSDSQFRRNVGHHHSGLYATAPNGDIRVRSSQFVDNRAPTHGGAIYVGSANEIEVDGVTVSGTESLIDGALAVGTAGTATIRNSTIVGNTTAGNGGGVGVGNTPVLISNTTISGNTAGGDGGALFTSLMPVTVVNSTVVDNVAGGVGGAFAWGAFGSVSVDHSIVWGNTATVGPVADGTMNIDRSFVDDLTDLTVVGADNTIGIDPQLGPLGDHGGPTPTLRPTPFSPVIDAGDPAIAGAADFDQRGSDRVVGTIDIGAVEIQEEERLLWVPVEPARILDTRIGGTTIDGLHAGGGALPNEGEVEVQAAARAGVPADATAIIVNMTAVDATGNGFAVAHACLDERPTAAGLNYTAGVNLGNEVIAGLDATGSVCVFAKTATEMVLDVVGYVPADSAYAAVDPARLLETRSGLTTIDGAFNGTGKPGAAGEIEVDIAGRAGVPSDAAAAVLYVAAVDAPDAGFLVVDDCEGARPNASSLNYIAGVNRGNEIVSPLSDGGTICIFTRRAIEVTVDVVGYVPAVSEFHGLDQPSRLFETRAGLSTIDGQHAAVGAVGAGETVEVQVTRRAGIPATATTVTINATAIGAQQNGNLVIWACGAKPLAAGLNYVAGVNGGNELIAGLSPSGSLCVRSLRAIDLTLDVSGFTDRLDAVSDVPVKGELSRPGSTSR